MLGPDLHAHASIQPGRVPAGAGEDGEAPPAPMTWDLHFNVTEERGDGVDDWSYEPSDIVLAALENLKWA